MEVKVFLVLLVFLALFLGGGVLVANGLLTGKKRQLWWGIALLVISIALTATGIANI